MLTLLQAAPVTRPRKASSLSASARAILSKWTAPAAKSSQGPCLSLSPSPCLSRSRSRGRSRSRSQSLYPSPCQSPTPSRRQSLKSAERSTRLRVPMVRISERLAGWCAHEHFWYAHEHVCARVTNVMHQQQCGTGAGERLPVANENDHAESLLRTEVWQLRRGAWQLQIAASIDNAWPRHAGTCDEGLFDQVSNCTLPNKVCGDVGQVCFHPLTMMLIATASDCDCIDAPSMRRACCSGNMPCWLSAGNII